MVERKRLGLSDSSSAAVAPRLPFSDNFCSRIRLEETTAISDMANKPFKRIKARIINMSTMAGLRGYPASPCCSGLTIVRGLICAVQKCTSGPVQIKPSIQVFCHSCSANVLFCLPAAPAASRIPVWSRLTNTTWQAPLADSARRDCRSAPDGAACAKPKFFPGIKQNLVSAQISRIHH